MRIPQLWLVIAMLLILSSPAVASADGHRAGLFGGYSIARGSTLSGANVSFDYAGTDETRKYLAAMVDYSFHDGDGFTRHIFMGGVNASRRFNRVVLGGHALFGGVWGDGSADAAGTFGVDVQIIAAPKVLTASSVQVGPMARADYIVRAGSSPGFWRVSTGLVVRWPKQ